MNDERLGKAIGEFYRETDVIPPDSKESAHQVATRLPQTPQVRRRWWQPSVRRAPASPTDADRTTESQPSPIQATNGHTPTIIGRTQTMFSPVKAITAGALVFAIGGVMLIAQPFDQQGGVPGAQPDEGEYSGVTVTVTQQCTGVGHADCDWTASDPRLPDTLQFEWTGNVEVEAAGDAGIDAGLAWGDVGFEGPDGGWTGHTYVLWGEPTHNFLVLSGTGANEGWQYVASSIDPDSHFGDFEWTGTLYEGEPPPYPEAPAE